MDEPISTNCPAEDAPEDAKYHPLILQNTLYSQILAVTSKIESEKKHNYLPNLHNAFQNALKCDECCSALESDIIEFACQHKFCSKCSTKITSCSQCTETGHDVSSTFDRNFSFLLDEIIKMKEHYNAESVIFNLVRFLINPSSMDSRAHSNSYRPKNLVFKTPRVSTSVKKSTSKRILAKTEKSSNTKRKLLLSKETDSPAAPPPECDSETLFLCLQDKTEKCEKIVHSYLEEQDSILDKTNKYDRNLKTYSKRAKRKSSCLELDKQLSNDEIPQQKERGDPSNFASPALKKIKLDAKENSNGANKITAYISSTKKRQKVSEESCESASDSGLKGTFIGFEQSCADQSYDKFNSVQKHYINICAKLGSTNVVDEDTSSKGKRTNEENISQASRRSSRRYGRTRQNGDLEPEKSSQPAKTLSETRGKRRSVKSNERPENILESDLNEKLIEENLEKQSDVPEVDRASTRKSQQRKPDVEKPALRENLRKRVSLSEAAEIPLHDNSGKNAGNDDIDPAKNETEKENLDAIASDYEMEDVVDTRLWERHDRQTRKKQKLFKSLKERKKKNVLLTLLEEKKLQKEKQSQPESIESEVSSSEADKLVSTKKDESLSLSHSMVKEPGDVPIPDETTVDQKLSRDVALLSPKGSPKSVVDVKNSPHDDEHDEDESIKSSPKPVSSLPSTITNIDEGPANFPQKSPEKEIANTDACPVVTVPKSPATEDYIASDGVSTPSMERVQFRYPTPVTKPSTESMIVSPSPTHFEGKFDDGFANSSTPIQMKGQNGKTDEKSTPRNDENDETLKLNCANSPRTSVERKSNTTQEKIVEYETMTAEDTVKQKCEKLRRSISNQNEKLLVGLKRNFGVKSPQSLLIEKSKSPSVSKRCKDVREGIQSSIKNDECPDIDRNEAMNMSTISIESDINNASTVPNSSTTREVACQTTSDLHVALLAQEFPHLFQKSNPLSSVYDTPAQSEIRPKNRISPNIKTPEPSLLDSYSRAKYTTVSSVTTSEKKRGEVEFACRSVLHDTLRTPFSGVGANSSPVDISSISILPSSEKKTPSSVELTSDKRRLSVRLNFQNDGKLYSNSDSVGSPMLNDEESYSKDIISCTNDDIVPFCAKIKMTAAENSLPASTQSNKTDGKRSDLSSPSKEMEFAEFNEENRGTSRANSNSNTQSDRNVEEISTMDPDFIPDSVIQVQDDVEMFKEGDNVMISKSPETPKSDDEDVDFVAGTPMCSQKENIENAGTPNQGAKVSDSISTHDDKSHLLFDSNDYLISKIAGISDRHSVSKTMDENSSSINIIPASFSLSKPCSSRSLDFSNMKTEIEEKVICFFTSGLKEIDFRLTKAFCEKFPVIMQDKLTDESTHLIVKTDYENRASRTFKYLQAIVNNIFIVSISWVEECLRCGRIVNEENFVPLDSSNESGPLRAYNVAKGLTPSPLSWLRDYCLLFEQPIPQGCTLVQLQEIARKTGAVVVNTLNEMDAYPGHHHIVIISDDDENMESMAENIKNWLQRYHAVAVEFNWLLEVIGRNRLVPFVDHEFAEVPSDLLRRFNFPNEMLESEMENAD